MFTIIIQPAEIDIYFVDNTSSACERAINLTIERSSNGQGCMRTDMTNAELDTNLHVVQPRRCGDVTDIQ